LLNACLASALTLLREGQRGGEMERGRKGESREGGRFFLSAYVCVAHYVCVKVNSREKVALFGVGEGHSHSLLCNPEAQ
jgi:hypothetical protein